MDLHELFRIIVDLNKNQILWFESSIYFAMDSLNWDHLEKSMTIHDTWAYICDLEMYTYANMNETNRYLSG